ncbi:hypothetical protein K3495_g1864 [Podosphaera aphanis]|nr:hypothetical protein K3495_g1864 [Podosphaera aphanis]
MLASEIIYSSDDDEIENAYNAVRFDFAFPSEVINGIKILRTYKEAVNDPQFSKQWTIAMAEELTSLISNETWKPLNPDGSIERFKARLVARGFSQVQGQDYTETFAPTLSSRFKAKDLGGGVERVLGIRITRDREKRNVYLDQEQYLIGVLERFGITNAQHKKKKIPVTDYESLRPASKQDTRINVTGYQQAIGSLMYAMVLTRPDIAFVLGKLSQYMSDPAQHHGSALKKLMRYLKATVSQKLRYGPGRGTKFGVYSDADWASDKADRKSVSGGVVMFYGGPI